MAEFSNPRASKLAWAYLALAISLSLGFLAVVLFVPALASTSVRQSKWDTVNRNAAAFHDDPSLPSASAVITTSSYEWEALILPSGVTSLTVTDLAVDPLNSDSIFLASYSGLFHSTDAGEGWTRVATDTLHYVYRIKIATQDPARMYAHTWGLWRSDDGGNNWNPMASPANICDYTVAPSQADRLYARTCPFSTGTPLFRSDDGGQTWITPTESFTQPLHSIAIFPTQSDLLVASGYTGLYRSANAGADWELIGPGIGGELVFEPNPPHTLYFGYYQGLLRSQDAGQSWEDSLSGLPYSVVLPSPFDEDTILGGSESSYWRFEDRGELWKTSAWETPGLVFNLYRGVQDNRAIYARTDSGVWRYVLDRRSWPYAVFLPAVQRETPEAFPEAALLALEQANLYRARTEAGPLYLHPAIVAATQNHADYHMLNYDDPSAWDYGPHGEVENKPGYTGRWPSDRIRYAGFPWFGGSEIMHYIGDPIDSVDGWAATIYHRVIMLAPGSLYTGYGSGKNRDTAVDVMDFGSGVLSSGEWEVYRNDYPLGYPADGQSDVPVEWGGGESPDPLPPGASRPVGYPFTLQGVGGSLQVDWIEMRDGNGELVAVHPNPPDCPAFNCYGLIPVEPLQANTSYTVSARGAVGAVTFERTWTFTTGSEQELPAQQAPVWLGPAYLEGVSP